MTKDQPVSTWVAICAHGSLSHGVAHLVGTQVWSCVVLCRLCCQFCRQLVLKPSASASGVCPCTSVVDLEALYEKLVNAVCGQYIFIRDLCAGPSDRCTQLVQHIVRHTSHLSWSMPPSLFFLFALVLKLSSLPDCSIRPMAEHVDVSTLPFTRETEASYCPLSLVSVCVCEPPLVMHSLRVMRQM